METSFSKRKSGIAFPSDICPPPLRTQRAWKESFGASHARGLPDSVELEDSSLGTESPLLRGPRRILWVALNAVAAKNATGFLLCSSPLLALMVSSTMWMEGYSAKHLYESSTNDSTFLASTTQRHSTPPVDSLKCAIFPNVALKFEETCYFHTSNIIAQKRSHAEQYARGVCKQRFVIAHWIPS